PRSPLPTLFPYTTLFRSWTFGSFAAVLAQTGTLYLMAAVVLPEQVGDQQVDLAAYYDQHHQWFFGFLLVTLVISVIKDVIINGRDRKSTRLNSSHLVISY